jgi:hypothetical protein
LDSTPDAEHEDCLEAGLRVKFREELAERVEKGHVPRQVFGTGKDVGCSFDGGKAGRTQKRFSVAHAFHVASSRKQVLAVLAALSVLAVLAVSEVSEVLAVLAASEVSATSAACVV